MRIWYAQDMISRSTLVTSDLGCSLLQLRIDSQLSESKQRSSVKDVGDGNPNCA